MIYICWEEIEYQFERWEYVGNGEFEPVMKETAVKKSALWSEEETEERMKQAKEWIKTQRPLGWIEKR